MTENAEPGDPGQDRELLEALAQRVQDLEDLVEELVAIALVNRSGLLSSVGKGLITREELRKVHERIEIAHGQARETGEEYRILPGDAAYFLEAE